MYLNGFRSKKTPNLSRFKFYFNNNNNNNNNNEKNYNYFFIFKHIYCIFFNKTLNYKISPPHFFSSPSREYCQDFRPRKNTILKFSKLKKITKKNSSTFFSNQKNFNFYHVIQLRKMSCTSFKNSSDPLCTKLQNSLQKSNNSYTQKELENMFKSILNFKKQHKLENKNKNKIKNKNQNNNFKINSIYKIVYRNSNSSTMKIGINNGNTTNKKINRKTNGETNYKINDKIHHKTNDKINEETFNKLPRIKRPISPISYFILDLPNHTDKYVKIIDFKSVFNALPNHKKAKYYLLALQDEKRYIQEVIDFLNKYDDGIKLHYDKFKIYLRTPIIDLLTEKVTNLLSSKFNNK